MSWKPKCLVIGSRFLLAIITPHWAQRPDDSLNSSHVFNKKNYLIYFLLDYYCKVWKNITISKSLDKLTFINWLVFWTILWGLLYKMIIRPQYIDQIIRSSAKITNDTKGSGSTKITNINKQVSMHVATASHTILFLLGIQLLNSMQILEMISTSVLPKFG